MGRRTDSKFAVIKGETYNGEQMPANDSDALSIKIKLPWVFYQEKIIKKYALYLFKAIPVLWS